MILTHNQLEYTRQCLPSILRHTGEPCELVVVDNGSTDGTVDYLNENREKAVEGCDAGLGMEAAYIPGPEETGPATALQGDEEARRPSCTGLRVIRNETNLGFAAGNNLGMNEARGDYVLLMNNDLVVTPGWLGRMIACMERNPRIGIVGPMSNYVSGPQFVEEVGYDLKSLKGLNAFARAFGDRFMNQAERVVRVVGFCMLIRRAVIERIGGLDERFGLGNFEDDDFCLRAALAGFESWIARDCFVHHFGSRTFLGANIDYEESLRKNWERFKQKWGIPTELPYGSGYDLASILSKGFDPKIHHVPLNRRMPVALTRGNRDGVIEGRLAEGEQRFLEGRLEDAERIFRAVLLDHPNHSKALNDLACLHWKMGRKLEALQEVAKAMEMDPDDPDVVWNVGQFLKEMGRERETREIYTGYSEKHPDEEAMRKVLRQWSNASNGVEAGSFVRESWLAEDDRLQDAEALLCEGHFREAEQILRGILRAHPAHARALNDLACLLWETARIEEALQALTRALETDADQPDAIWNLGQFLKEMGRDQEAEGVYRAFLARRPDEPEIRKVLERWEQERPRTSQPVWS